MCILWISSRLNNHMCVVILRLYIEIALFDQPQVPTGSIENCLSGSPMRTAGSTQQAAGFHIERSPESAKRSTACWRSLWGVCPNLGPKQQYLFKKNALKQNANPVAGTLPTSPACWSSDERATHHVLAKGGPMTQPWLQSAALPQKPWCWYLRWK